MPDGLAMRADRTDVTLLNTGLLHQLVGSAREKPSQLLVECSGSAGRWSLTGGQQIIKIIHDELVNCAMLKNRQKHWNPSYSPVGIVKVKGE